jgi:polysaccharide chain length determinant protein (PEP-CTERM system associated)
MESQKEIRLEDVAEILKRRWRAFIASALAVFFLAAAVALLWAPVYRSTSTILIEEQEISREYVMATVTSFAEQRLQSINQRIMSSTRLLEIINRFNLYADKRNRMTTEEIVDDMRKKDIKFDTLMADVIDRRTGQKTMATIAFTVSYEGKNPTTVQQVGNVLASLYLEENMKVVDQQTTGTMNFLDDEMKSVQGKLFDLEKRIATFKEQNPHALPELMQFNLQTLDWNERNYDQLIEQLRTLREKESYLRSELATMAPDSVNQEKARLKELQITLINLKTRFSDEYPDVVKTKREIVELEKKLQSSEGGRPAVEDKPDNPAYVALAAQLASVQSEIESAKRQIDDLNKRKDEYRSRLEASPRVEETYRNLMSERNNTQAKYDDLMKKYMEAKVAHGLEKEQMGERFTLIDPARLPEKPVRPNRVAILLIGLILGLGAGIGTASLHEVTDRSARRAEDLTRIFPFPVLTEVPEIITLEDLQKKKNKRTLIIGTTAAIIILLVFVVHFFFMDLDILWAKIVRKLFA